MTTRVTVWHEFRQEHTDPPVKAIYPDGMHAAIADGLRDVPGLEVRTATLDEPENGLPDDVLDTTDVLTWWGHVAHDDVTDETVDRVHARVLDGMGLVVLPAEAGQWLRERRPVGARLLEDAAQPVDPGPGGMRRERPDRAVLRAGADRKLLGVQTGNRVAEPAGVLRPVGEERSDSQDHQG